MRSAIIGFCIGLLATMIAFLAVLTFRFLLIVNFGDPQQPTCQSEFSQQINQYRVWPEYPTQGKAA
jgi:hypothetical protein